MVLFFLKIINQEFTWPHCCLRCCFVLPPPLLLRLARPSPRATGPVVCSLPTVPVASHHCACCLAAVVCQMLFGSIVHQSCWNSKCSAAAAAPTRTAPAAVVAALPVVAGGRGWPPVLLPHDPFDPGLNHVCRHCYWTLRSSSSCCRRVRTAHSCAVLAALSWLNFGCLCFVR
jgi:hypothetical protein